jgi:uncharacterized lipoprotein YbaY
MLQKLIALARVFRKGEQVADPAAWKTGQIAVTALAAFLVAAAQAAAAFGLPLPVDEAAWSAVAAGVIALVNIVLTVATTRKIGLPPVAPPAPGEADGGEGFH